jgi:sporulation related protein
MADQYNDNARNTGSVIEDDDPLAELARIIGYDRPAGTRPDAKGDTAPAADRSSEIDLEAELLGELEPSSAEVPPQRATVSQPPALAEDDAADTGDEFSYDASLREDFREPGYEPVSADPVAGVPDELPFDPFAAAEQPVSDATAVDERLVEWPVAFEDDGDAAMDLDLPEEELYQALEDELTITDEDLSSSLSSGAETESLVSDFGDEEAPADEPETAVSETEFSVAEDTPVSTAVPDSTSEDDFDDVFAEWDAMVEADTEEPTQFGDGADATVLTGGDEATIESDADVLPAFLGTAPLAADSFVQARGGDDDILAEISRFELPLHGEVVAVNATGGDEEEFSTAYATETADFSDAGVAAPGEETGNFAETASGGSVDFDAFEAELSADLDDFRTRLDRSALHEEPLETPADAFPEIEADFDDAADDFLAEEDFDLTLEEFNPADDPVEPVDPVDFAADSQPALEPVLDDEFAAADPMDEAEVLSFDAAPSEPPSVEPEVAAEAPADDMTAAFSDFLNADEPSFDGVAEPTGMDIEGDASEFAARSVPADAEEGPFDAFFPQQPVLPAVAVAPMATYRASESAHQDEVAEEDDWLASLEAELEEDVAEQEASLAAAELPEPELPEPEVPYATADDDGDVAFDPSAIVNVDEMPESVGAFDVPDMPVEAAASEDDFESFFESELDREFADLVEAESHDDISAGSSGWYAAPAEADTAGETYSGFENDIGFTGQSDGGYRPHPLPVDADAPVAAADRGETDDDRRKPLIAGLVLGLALLLGGVVFGWSWISGGATGDGTPKIIMADKDPVKVAPENPGGAKVPNQDKAVYEKVDGSDTGQASQPRLVDSAEEPVDVVQRTIDPEMLPLEGRGEIDAAAPEKAEDRLTEGDTEAAGSAASGETMLSPRRVRTMIVRPDGTIVARPQEEPAPAETASAASDAPAPAGIAPSAAPMENTSTDPVAVAPSASETTSGETPASLGAETAQDGVATTDEALAPVRSVTTVPIRQAPVPTSRPAEQPVNVVGRVSGNGNASEVAATDPAPAASAEPAQTQQAAAPANPGGYYMQIASQPSAEGAQASYQNLSRKFSGIIGGRGVDIKRADIPNKGIYHRVRIPAGSREEANALCAQYKSAGGSCLVTR